MTSLTKIIIIFFIICLFLKIFFSLLNKKVLKYIFTPLTTFLVILIPISNFSSRISSFTIFILFGLIFSLIGDIFNMVEKEENSQLIYGIIAFLLTHLFYILAFLKYYIFHFYQLSFAILLLVIIALVFNMLKKNIKLKTLKTGILIYIFVVTTMLFFALGTLKKPITSGMLFIPLGSVLFWLSDLTLGIDAFYKKIRFSVLIIWGLYAPAQLLIALSTLLF